MPIHPEQISLVVGTYNQPRRLKRVLEALAAGSQKPGEILIADDGSGVATRELVERWAEHGVLPITHVWQEDEGFRKSRIQNRAFARARGAYLVLLDGDCIPHRDFVRDHADLAEEGYFVQSRRAHLLKTHVPAYLNDPKPFWHLVLAGRVKRPRNGVRYPVPFIRKDEDVSFTLGCNYAAWTADVRAVNGYDEAFEGYGSEDWDLALRLVHLGRRRKHVRGRAAVLHLDHPLKSRLHAERNRALLEETRTTGRVRCTQGIEDLSARAEADV
jgi:glycosyltransferase involved in cell wall biosynthesis